MRIQAESYLVRDEPLNSAAHLEIELKGTAQIGSPDPRRRYPHARIHKWDPAGSGGKVVTQVGSKANEPFIVGRELGPGEQFEAELRVAVVPTICAPHRAEHVAVGEADQRQIMGLAAAENLDAAS